VTIRARKGARGLQAEVPQLDSGTTTALLEEGGSGPQLATITSAAGSFRFDSAGLFGLRLLDPETEEITVLQPPDFATVVETALSPTARQIRWSDVRQDLGGDIAVTVTVTLTDDDIDITLADVENESDLALNEAICPLLPIRPTQTEDLTREMLFIPHVAGRLLFNPVERAGSNAYDTTTNSSAVGFNNPGPTPIQLWAYYNADTQVCLHIQTTDTGGYRKQYRINSVDGRFRFGVVHYPENNRTPGNSYSAPWSTRLSVISGNFYHAAVKYRSWALANIPWMADRLPISNPSSDVSSTLKSTSIYVIEGLIGDGEQYQFDSFPRLKDQLDRLAAFYGTTNIAYQAYFWHTTGRRRPAVGQPEGWFPPKDSFSVASPNFLDECEGAGYAVIPYILPEQWSVGTSSWVSEGIEDRCAKDKDGAYIPASPAIVNTEPVCGQMSLGLAGNTDLIVDAWRDLVEVHRFPHLYLDLLAGTADPADYNEGLSAKGGGNLFRLGRRALAAGFRNLLRSSPGSPQGITVSEYTDETMLDQFDVLNSYGLGVIFAEGVGDYPAYGAWRTIYGDRIYFIDYSNTVSPGKDAFTGSYAFLMTLKMAIDFGDGRMLTLGSYIDHEDALAGVGAIADGITPGTMAADKLTFHTYVRPMVQCDDTPRMRKYRLHGERLEEIPGTYQYLLHRRDAAVLTAQIHAGLFRSTEDSPAKLGLFLVNWLPIPTTFLLQLDSDRYPDLAGSHEIVELHVGSPAESVPFSPNTFVDSLEVTISMPASGVRVFEIR
jgi:hypothetical protein